MGVLHTLFPDFCPVRQVLKTSLHVVHAHAYTSKSSPCSDGASVDAAGGKLDPTAVSVQSGKTYEQEFAPEIERAQVQ